MKEAADYVLEALEADPKRLIRFKEVCDAIGMTTPNFRRSVRQHEDFEDVLAENGIVERPKDSVGQTPHPSTCALVSAHGYDGVVGDGREPGGPVLPLSAIGRSHLENPGSMARP